MTTTDLAEHRARLRARFIASPGTLSEVELLELLLTFAIPQQDMVPVTETLLARFGSLESTVAGWGHQC